MTLELVTDATQAKINILKYEEGVDACAVAFRMFSNVRSWYVFEDNGLHFGPARFVAYNNYSLQSYGTAEKTDSKNENEHMSNWAQKADGTLKKEIFEKLSKQYLALGKNQTQELIFTFFHKRMDIGIF